MVLAVTSRGADTGKKGGQSSSLTPFYVTTGAQAEMEAYRARYRADLAAHAGDLDHLEP